MTGLSHLSWRSLGPAVPRAALVDTGKAALGVGLGLAIANLTLWLALPAGPAAVLLIAPFGATGYLIYAVPSSPLAQPYSAVVGNTVSALAAMLVLLLPLPGLALAGLAVAAAVVAMGLLRAQHPPGGAVALACVLAALSGHPVSWLWPLAPVALGTAVLVGFGMLWAGLTGRAYPFRLPPAPASAPVAPAVPALVHRLAPSPQALAESLTQLRLAANIGVEDLARVIDRAEALSPGLDPAALHAGAVMTPHPLSVPPETGASALIEMFRQHGFKSLPVTDKEGTFLGLVPQSALLGAEEAATARDLARPALTLPPGAPMSDVAQVLGTGHQAAVPILDGGRLAGVITRSDLIAALLHQIGLR